MDGEGGLGFPVDEDGAVGSRDCAFGFLEVGGEGADAGGFPTGAGGFRAEEVAGEEVGGGGSPGVVPVLVGFVFLVPSFPTDGGAAVDHVFP